MSSPSAPTTERAGALSPQRAAAYLDTTVGTLAKWRYEGSGPPFVKLGRKVVYRVETLDAYLRDLEIATTGGAR